MAKIMIVDDAAFMRMMLKDILSEAGFTKIVEAKNGNEALILHKVECPEIVILDVTMPDIDGIDVLFKMKQFQENTKVIMCSSMGQEDMVTKCFEKGADDFIMKPFKPERVIQAVSQFSEAE
ncbi:MAG: response regulator [Oscillospiraceae bacterium]|nr:response regulator [Candidatus Limimonas coprohippi]MCQ2488817.1 response regulator [Clostridia bacterium]